MKDSFDSFKEELQLAISSSPIIFISHNDVTLVEKALVSSLQYWHLDKSVISEFYCGIGEIEFDTKKLDTDSVYRGDDQSQMLTEYLKAIVYREYASYDKISKKVFIIRDIQAFLNEAIDPDGTSHVDSNNILLFTLLQIHAGNYFKEDRENDDIYTIILLDTTGENKIPTPIESITTSLMLAPPSYDEIMAEIKAYDNRHTEKGCCSFDNESCETLCRALQGLDLQEIKRILRTISCKDGGLLLRGCIPQALEEKRKLVKREGILEVFEANESFKDIGGLENLKEDLKNKSYIFNNLDKAIKDGIRIPKGIMIVGVPGCGKTMMAKAISNEFRIPLLRLDMNRILGQYVGQSEQNMKKALYAAESASPCVLWIDEIEKAFSGASGNSNESKNDTVLRMMGLFLTWMQENKNPVYVVATANDVMRSELMRKGRFDEVYFVDFPSEQERFAILSAKIKKISTSVNFVLEYTDEDLNISHLAKNSTEGFSGAELQCLVESAVENAYIECMRKKQETSLTNVKDITVELKGEDLVSIASNMMEHLTSEQLIRNASTNNDVQRFLKYSHSLKMASKSEGLIYKKYK